MKLKKPEYNRKWLKLKLLDSQKSKDYNMKQNNSGWVKKQDLLQKRMQEELQHLKCNKQKKKGLGKNRKLLDLLKRKDLPRKLKQQELLKKYMKGNKKNKE